MQDEIHYALRQFKAAFRRLQEGVQVADSALLQDGVVQRFEFTFELLWKALKVLLEDQGIIALTPKDCLQAAFRQGWIEDERVFLQMLEARNKMSHEYDESEARKVFRQIKKRFLKPMRTLLERLDKIRRKKAA